MYLLHSTQVVLVLLSCREIVKLTHNKIGVLSLLTGNILAVKTHAMVKYVINKKKPGYMK